MLAAEPAILKLEMTGTAVPTLAELNTPALVSVTFAVSAETRPTKLPAVKLAAVVLSKVLLETAAPLTVRAFAVIFALTASG